MLLPFERIPFGLQQAVPRCLRARSVVGDGEPHSPELADELAVGCVPRRGRERIGGGDHSTSARFTVDMTRATRSRYDKGKGIGACLALFDFAWAPRIQAIARWRQ